MKQVDAGNVSFAIPSRNISEGTTDKPALSAAVDYGKKIFEIDNVSLLAPFSAAQPHSRAGIFQDPVRYVLPTIHCVSQIPCWCRLAALAAVAALIVASGKFAFSMHELGVNAVSKTSCELFITAFYLSRFLQPASHHVGPPDVTRLQL